MLVEESTAYRIVSCQCRVADNRRLVLRGIFYHPSNSAGLEHCPITGMEDARLALDAANVNLSIPVCVVLSHLGSNLFSLRGLLGNRRLLGCRFDFFQGDLALWPVNQQSVKLLA